MTSIYERIGRCRSPATSRGDAAKDERCGEGRRTSGFGDVRYRDGTVRLECGLEVDGGRTFLELRARSNRDSLDLWRKLDEDEFRVVGGVSCPLERFAEELFRLLGGAASDSRRLELTEDGGRFAVALIHVDGAWETEECVIPVGPTPAAVQLADLWSSLRRRRAESAAAEAENAEQRAALARACPENASLVALRESVEFWRRRGGGTNAQGEDLLESAGGEEDAVVVGPIDAKIGAVRLRLDNLAKRKDEAGRKLKALEELAQTLGAACGSLVVQRKELQEAVAALGAAARSRPTPTRGRRLGAGSLDDLLAALRAEHERTKVEAARGADAVRAKKRRIQFGLVPDYRSKAAVVAEKQRVVAACADQVRSRERAAASIAGQLVVAGNELKAWNERRDGLARLEQWLAAKDGHLAVVIGNGQVPQLQDLLEQVAGELGERAALTLRLKDQLSGCRQQLCQVAVRK